MAVESAIFRQKVPTQIFRRLFRYFRYILLRQHSNSVTLATDEQANKQQL